MNQSFIRAIIAEIIGTFILVYFGCGAIIIDQIHEGLFGLQGIAFAFGLIVLAIVYSIGHVSGAHINPAVTLALACTNKFSFQRVPLYVLAQCIGAITAAFCLKISLANGDSLGMTLPSGSLTKAFFLETITTAFLLFVVMATATDKRAHAQFAPFAIASVIVVDILISGAITGASMNPARSLGPALIEQNLEHLWLYLTAPCVGALLGAFCYESCAAFRSPSI